MSIEDQMHIVGRVLGWMIFAGYLWLTLNFFVRQFNRDSLMAFRRVVIRSHVYVPLFILTVIVLHLLMELIHVGFFLTGVITVSLMAAQIALGALRRVCEETGEGELVCLAPNSRRAAVLFHRGACDYRDRRQPITTKHDCVFGCKRPPD